MRPLRPASLLLAVALAAGRIGAQPAPPADTSAPVASASAAPLAPDRPRPISPAIAARLAEQMPKFTPPKPLAPAPDKSPVLASPNPPDPAAASTADQPRNTIIRLPNYVVREEKPAAFKERHILTFKGRLDLGYKRNPGLHVGSLPFLSNDGVALAMLAEDFRLERKAEMEGLAGLLTDPAERTKGKAEVQNAFLRASEYGYNGMAPK